MVDFDPREPMIPPGVLAPQRGGLVLVDSFRSGDSPLPAFGPDTPPPSNGDWIIDETGNNVNNTTIILSGNLNVTTGDLTLDNVTLIINSTTDGQYGINVSAGGVLTLTNCNITAFDGSLHYRFAVYGMMTMDRCDVSEMWGDPDSYRAGGGVTVFSNGTAILSSRISNGETSGIQIHSCAELTVLDTQIDSNGRTGLLSCDDASGKIQHCFFENNTRHGISVLDQSRMECGVGYHGF